MREELGHNYLDAEQAVTVLGIFRDGHCVAGQGHIGHATELALEIAGLVAEGVARVELLVVDLEPG